MRPMRQVRPLVDDLDGGIDKRSHAEKPAFQQY